MALQIAESPEHSVLPRASTYDLRKLQFTWSESVENSVLEIEASTHSDYAILRFRGVEDLHIPCGIIGSVRLLIQDTSQCPSKTHSIPRVRVGGSQRNENTLCFWANSVERIKNHVHTNL